MSFKSWAVQAYTRVNRHLPSPHRVGGIYLTPVGMFSIPESDAAIAHHLRRGRHFDKDELASIETLLAPDSRVLVVGTHVGTLAIPLARSARSVDAIEANPNTFRFLSANVALNGVENVTLHQVAAGEATGSIDFVASKENTGGSKRMPKISDPRYFYDSPETISVSMVRLDDLLPAHFDLIVMDIEGSEYFALQGMPAILARARHLFVEFLPHHLKNVSDASPQAFWAVLAPHFSRLHSSVTGKSYVGDQIEPTLIKMYEEGFEDPSLHFSKG